MGFRIEMDEQNLKRQRPAQPGNLTGMQFRCTSQAREEGAVGPMSTAAMSLEIQRWSFQRRAFRIGN